MAATCRESHSPKKTGKASRPQRLQLEDAENVPSPPISPGQAGSGGPRAAVSPTKLTQKLGSPGSQMRSPLAQRLLQPLSPAQEMNAQVRIQTKNFVKCQAVVIHPFT